MRNNIIRAVKVALIVPIIWFGYSPPAEASPYLDCRNEDSVGCVYDARHPAKGFHYAPWNYYNSDTGKTWRLPHNIAHYLLDLPGARTEWMPCDQEDSLNCVWRADVRGNREGWSYFTSWRGITWYVPHHIARHMVRGL